MKTQSHTVEDLLNSNNLDFLSIFDEGQIGLAIVGPDFRFIEVNKAFCQIMGYSKPELKGLTFRDVTHPSDQRLPAALEKRLLTGAFRGELIGIHKNGIKLTEKINETKNINHRR